MEKPHNPFRIKISDTIKNRFLSNTFKLAEPFLEKITALSYLADRYDDLKSKGIPPSEFCAHALSELNISVQINQEELKRIPESGPCVIVANHPFGAIEGVILIELLKSRRSDFKILANFLLGRVPDLNHHFIFVDPFGSKSSTLRNTQPLREAIDHLRSGGLLATFPSGTVSHLHWGSTHVSDPTWNTNIARITKRTQAPVIPIFFEGRNSSLFQISGLVHPLLRTILLPRELVNRRNSQLKVHIGNYIPWERLSEFSSDKDLVSYLRLRTYLLGGLKHHTDILTKKKKKRKQIVHQRKLEDIIPQVDPHLLRKEFYEIPFEQILVENKNFIVSHAPSSQIPFGLREIGRLREITFRAVSEGSGKSIDLDRFDNYYEHLIIWSKVKEEIAGAYRLGNVKDIIKQFGVGGLYTSTLFAYGNDLVNQLGDSLEVGRSFIRPEYQRSYAALDMLWKGIGSFVVKNPKCKILFGTVSISNEYNSVSRMLIASFLKQNNFIPEFASLIKPRNPFKALPLRGVDAKSSSFVVKDLDQVNELLKEIEAKHHSIPVLLRQYLRLGGKFLGFNIDRSFGDVLDGLIYVDLSETDPKILARYLGKEGSKSFLEYHGKMGNKK